jgi:hypothetical protein
MWNGCVKEHKRASKGMRSESSESRDLSRFDQYNLIDEEEEKVDELQRYLDAPTEKVQNPILWWQAHEAQYPLLSKMAFDLLAAPAISAECERVFSRGGRVLGHDRPRTHGDLAEATECLRAWIILGLIQL